MDTSKPITLSQVSRADPVFNKQLQEKFHDEVLQELANPPCDSLIPIAAINSLKGDGSLIAAVAEIIRNKTILGQSLTVVERYWLANVMTRAMNSPTVSRAIAGRSGKGAPKKMYRSLIVARQVLHEILCGNCLSVETAWEHVASEFNLESSTVRKYWAQHKKAICDAYPISIDADGEVDQRLKEILRERRGKK